MGLETGTGIGDLVPTNPLSTDAVSAGDDHIRLIKTVMKSITFLTSIVPFTASGTWIRPANVRFVLVYCLGGGSGGGGGNQSSGYAGGGGASGATAIKWVDVTTKPTVTVTIGAGGTAGTGGTTPTAGGAGGNTTFVDGSGTHCLAAGGGIATTHNQGAAAQPRTVCVGDVIFPGGDGSYGEVPHSTTAMGGHGGGAGARMVEAARPNSGGGGGGGVASVSEGGAGGGGGSGYCFVLEFGW